jgi:AbrB family looped-hinge helix DNA binding protein
MYVKMSNKGQITIPKAIREKLNVDQEGGILFLMENDEVKLKGVPGSPVNKLAGSLKKYAKKYTSLKKVRETIQDGIAKEIMEKTL